MAILVGFFIFYSAYLNLMFVCPSRGDNRFSVCLPI